MQLVEQTIIRKGDPRYDAIDHAAFASKNLYNAANYLVRHSFIFAHKYLGYASIYHLIKNHEAYTALPRKVSNDVLRLLDKNWKAFFAALKAYHEHPEPFQERPRPPKYKDKVKGRNILIYDIQALSKPALRKGVIAPSQLGITVPTKHTSIKQVRIIPKSSHCVIEVVYEQEPEQASVDASLVAGIDLGLNNLATITSNKVGFTPRLINGRPLKSMNQWYNKRRAALQSRMPAQQFTSRHLERLTDKRNRRVYHILHTASRRIVDVLIREGIGTLVIGHNPQWKQEINIGKQNNQNFVNIPHARFIQMVMYKCELVGITVIVTEESYTSKCSFLDNEPIGKHEQYAGKRVKRGLFRTSTGKCINADVNGSLNIIRKVLPDAFTEGKGIAGAAVHPCRLAITV